MCKNCGDIRCGHCFGAVIKPPYFDRKEYADITDYTQTYTHVLNDEDPPGNYKIEASEWKKYYGLKVNNTPLGYIPATSGNLSNLNEFVEDSDGDQWIIDAIGNAKKLIGGDPTVNWDDRKIAFGRNSSNGLDYDNNFSFYYPLGSLQINKGNVTPTVLTYTHAAAITVFTNAAANAQTVVQGVYAGDSVGTRSILQINRARGNLNSYSITSAEDYLGGIIFGGFDGSTFQNGASLEAIQDGPASSGNVPARLSIRTGTYFGNRIERLVVKSDGKIGIGTPTPTNILDINGDLRIRTIASASDDDILTKDSNGVVRTRTVASLGIPVVVPSALSKTDDTNVTLTLTGSPLTALLQGVNIVAGWTGTLSDSRITSSSVWNTVIRPTNQIVVGNGTGLTSFGFFLNEGTGNITIGTRSVTPVGAYSLAVGYGNSSDNVQLVVGENNSIAIGENGNGSSFLGNGNSVTGSGSYYGTFVTGSVNTITGGAVYSKVIGSYVTVGAGGTGSLALADVNGSTLNVNVSNKFFSRFLGGYTFMLNNSTRVLDISNAGVVTVDNLSGAGTRWVVANSSGVLSTQPINVVPNTRVVTVNGQALDLSVDRNYGNYVALNVAYSVANSSHSSDLDTIRSNVEHYSAGGAGAPSGYSYGHVKTQAVSSSYAFQQYKDNGPGDSWFFRTLYAGVWYPFYQVATREWANSQGWTSNTGTVTNFNADDLSPLFTTSVSNATTAPNLSFTLPVLSQKLVFAAPWGASGTPFWRQLQTSDLQQNGATTGQVVMWDGMAWNPGTISAVPLTRNVTINGVMQNLSADRIWNVGTVTSVTSGNGMNFSNFTTNGTITLGTPSSVTLGSTNAVTATSHTHAFAPGGSTAQYIRGDGSLATFPNVVANGPVWNVQGGSTNATTNGQAIYHNGDVWIGNGAGTPSGYKLHVEGTSYFTTQIHLAFGTYVVWRNSANTDWLNGIRYNGSNQLELGRSGNDIYLPAYTSSRSADTRTTTDKILFVSASGLVKQQPVDLTQNDAGEVVYSGGTQVKTAGAGTSNVTFNTLNSVDNSFYSYDTTTGNYKLRFGLASRVCLCIASIQFTTAGGATAVVTMEFHLNTSGTVLYARSESHAGTGSMEIIKMLSGNANDYLALWAGCTGANITITSANLIMEDIGRTPP